jgi:hypothetical protein
MLAAEGISEDELLQDYKSWRKGGHGESEVAV